MRPQNLSLLILVNGNLILLSKRVVHRVLLYHSMWPFDKFSHFQTEKRCHLKPYVTAVNGALVAVRISLSWDVNPLKLVWIYPPQERKGLTRLINIAAIDSAPKTGRGVFCEASCLFAVCSGNSYFIFYFSPSPTTDCRLCWGPIPTVPEAHQANPTRHGKLWEAERGLVSDQNCVGGLVAMSFYCH